MRLVILDPHDNVATAADDLKAGGVATVGDTSVEVRDDIPRGHKIALRSITQGADIIRYGEIIGAATADITVGEHVHVQNLISKRIPGNGK